MSTKKELYAKLAATMNEHCRQAVVCAVAAGVPYDEAMQAFALFVHFAAETLEEQGIKAPL